LKEKKGGGLEGGARIPSGEEKKEKNNPYRIQKEEEELLRFGRNKKRGSGGVAE